MLELNAVTEMNLIKLESKHLNECLVQAWEHCFRSQCKEAQAILSQLSMQNWEIKLLNVCLEGMMHYQSQDFQASYQVFEKLFNLYQEHRGPWSDVEQLQMDWVIKQFGETAYKINYETYQGLAERLTFISSVCKSPISLSDQAQRLLNEGKLKEAEEKGEEALRLLRSNDYPAGIKSQIKADTCNILVATKNFLGKFEEAEQMINQIFTEKLDVRLQVNLLRKRGEALLYLGKMEEAKACFSDCLRKLDLSTDLPLIFTTYLRLAIAYQRNQEFSLALETYEAMLTLKNNKVNANEKTVLQWNIGALIHRLEATGKERPPKLSLLLERIGAAEDVLADAYRNVHGLPSLLLRSSWDIAVNHKEKTESTEIVAYIPYGYDVLDVHTMKCWEPHFSSIRNGAKTIEGRKNKEENRKIKAGDFIEFVSEKHEKFLAKVTDVVRYETLEDYLKDQDNLRQALPGVKDLPQAIKIYRPFNNSDEEIRAANGFLAIHVKVVEN